MKRKPVKRGRILVGGLPVFVEGTPSERDVDEIRKMMHDHMPLVDAIEKVKKHGYQVSRHRSGLIKVEGQSPMTTKELIEWARAL